MRVEEPDFSGATVRSVAGYEAVADFLRREMALGRIRPGDRLPPERRLSEQLGVSRETLRQGLRVLEGGGQIVILRGAAGGAIVQEEALDAALLRQSVRERADEIAALTEFREVVESAAAEMAATRVSAVDIAAMEAAQQELASSETKADCRHADTAFHLALAGAAGNPFIRDAVENARVRMFAQVDLMSFEFIRESSWEAHERILDAIRRGDAAAAAVEMRKHLETTRDEFTRIVGG